MFAKISWIGIFSARALTGQLCCLMVASSMGCASVAGLQDTQYCLANKTRAEISWLTCNDWKQRWDLGSDYAAGYKKGFYDAATGRGCKVPAVPPPCYWSSKYQDCEGQEAIACWYRGYQCGAAAAQSKGYPSFHDVPVGPCAPAVNMTGCQGCYSPDNCACNETANHAPIEMVAHPAEHQFHGGLFGQYGSALSSPTQQALVGVEEGGDESVAPEAPKMIEPKENSADGKSESEKATSSAEEASSSDKSKDVAESVGAKQVD